MSVMIFQAGGDSKIWGRNLKTKTVDPDDVAEHLANGWYGHPNDVPDEPLVGEQNVSVGGDTTNPVDMGEVSDGYHTFNELYDHRVRLFSSLMHSYSGLSWWSRKHSDGEEWEGWSSLALPRQKVKSLTTCRLMKSNSFLKAPNLSSVKSGMVTKRVMFLSDC